MRRRPRSPELFFTKPTGESMKMPKDYVDAEFDRLCAILNKCVMDRSALIRKCAYYMILYRMECKILREANRTQKIYDKLTALQEASITKLSASEQKAKERSGVFFGLALELAKKRDALRESARRAIAQAPRARQLTAHNKPWQTRR